MIKSLEKEIKELICLKATWKKIKNFIDNLKIKTTKLIIKKKFFLLV